MHDMNYNQAEDTLYYDPFETVQSARSRSAIAKRRAIKERIDQINEQRELRRLIEDSY